MRRHGNLFDKIALFPALVEAAKRVVNGGWRLAVGGWRLAIGDWTRRAPAFVSRQVAAALAKDPRGARPRPIAKRQSPSAKRPCSLDHHVKERMRIPGYVRYMDDFVLFSDERDRLRGALVEVREYLAAVLHLQLKDRATILAPAREGLPFLGFHVFCGMTRLRPENKRRSLGRLRGRARQLRRGEIDLERALASMRSIVAHVEHADTLRLRRKWFAELDHGIPDDAASPLSNR